MQYTVKYGDTIRMIAQRELGNAELWSDIVSLNNLSYPYISDVATKGVASPGDSLYLSIPEVLEIPEQESFGIDLSLSTDKINLSYGKGGDLSVGLDGDYQLLYEMDCLKQDISHRKMTPTGSLPYHPQYGSDLTVLVGSKKDANWRIKAQLETERTIRSDSRVTSVQDIQIEDIPTGVKIEYTAVAKGIKFRSGGVED